MNHGETEIRSQAGGEPARNLKLVERKPVLTPALSPRRGSSGFRASHSIGTRRVRVQANGLGAKEHEFPPSSGSRLT